MRSLAISQSMYILQNGNAMAAMMKRSVSMMTLLDGEAPLLRFLIRLPTKSDVIWYSPLSMPLRRALAHCSGVRPSAAPSIFLVNAGFVLFSVSYPGV